MSGKTLGFVVARGLAAWFLMHAINMLYGIAQYMSNKRVLAGAGFDAFDALQLAQIALYLAASAFLWYRADLFSPVEETVTQSSESITVDVAWRLTCSVVGLFMAMEAGSSAAGVFGREGLRNLVNRGEPVPITLSDFIPSLIRLALGFGLLAYGRRWIKPTIRSDDD